MDLDDTLLQAGPLVAGGDSLVRREGQKITFVEGALPGETVRIRVTNERKDLRNAVVESVTVPSPDRIAPPCPMFDVGCGGCQWQHAVTRAQHDYKVEIVRDSLSRIAKLPDAPVRFAGAVSDFGYRTTMRFAVVDGRAALHRRHSKEAEALDVCLIADPLLEELITESRFGNADEVTLRISSTTKQRVAVISGPQFGVRMPDDVVLDGSVTETVRGRDFVISAQSFFQSGLQAAELLTGTVDSMVPNGIGWLVDAYAGIGMLGGVIAGRQGARLTSIEQNPSASADARVNLSDLDAQIFTSEVAEVSLSGTARPDVVIADPARTGLGRTAAAALIELGAPLLILVSCDPASFARDVNLLSAAGYSLDDVAVLDMFPQTHHVETVSLFRR